MKGRKKNHRPPPTPLALGTLVTLGGLGLLAGCGGGGSSGGVDRPGVKDSVGVKPVVQKLETPLGLVGIRGSGSDVFVSFNLQDREYNLSDIQVEVGYDVDGDNEITGSEGDPSPTDEYFPCTEALDDLGQRHPLSSGLTAIPSARGRGADHVFVWDSNIDTPGQRFVTLDYRYTPQGRQVLASDGTPEFRALPGMRIRMRANDLSGSTNRWGAWTPTTAFDLNSNQQPSITINSAVGINGVNANAQGGAAATSNVVLNFFAQDGDSAGGAGVDHMAVHVDYAFVPPGNMLASDADLAALQWFPATTAAGFSDTGLITSPGAGTPNTYVWDSLADVGTVNADYVLRITPFDTKEELGATVTMTGAFRLDNYTVFNNANTALATPRVGHRATTLVNDVVLITGGRTTPTGASVNSSELFYPGTGQTTLGNVAPTAVPMNAARSYHTQTRLGDDRILVAGGFDASGNALNSIEVYDPTTGLWTTLGANMGTARARHTAVILASGDVLFAGGVDTAGNPLGSATVFRSATETCVAVPGSMTQARHSVEGALLPDGRVLIPGGKGASNAALSSVEIFTPWSNADQGAFTAAAAMSSARAEHSVSSGTNGKVIVTGGIGLNTVGVYDPESNTWDNTAPAMASIRAGHVGRIMGDGRILVAGGSNGTSIVAGAEQFDPPSKTFDAANNQMNTPRRDAAAAFLNNGRALIVGGLDASGNASAAVEVFTPDGGFNSLPNATIVTPNVPQSWAFGALLRYRLVDKEQDPAKVIFQYSIAGGPWDLCTPLDQTIADDVNEGLVSLETAAAASTLPIDPILKNTVGDHLFIWDLTADIAQADYPAVRVRVIPFGAGQGTMAVTNAFRVIRNSGVIPRFAPWVSPASGTVTINYHLQDPDPDSPTVNDARVEFEYAIDLNGDKQILEDDGEAWVTCAMASGGDGLGAGYTLVSTPGYNPVIGTDVNGWHTFVWDSVKDIGSPARGEIWSNIMVRLTPYDFPSTDTSETQGRREVLSGNNGFQIELDPNGLYLNQWSTESTTYSGSALGNVKLDETLTFSFNAPVDPATLGLATMRVLDLSGRQILGTYEIDGGDPSIVRFFPQVQEILAGAPKYTGIEAQTILTRGVTVRIDIPGYVTGSDAAAATMLKKAGWANGDPVASIANLIHDDFVPAFTATTSAGTAAYVSRGSAPGFVTLVPTGPGTNPYSSFTIEFDGPVSAETVNFNSFAIRIDNDADGVVDSTDSVVPGSLSLVNTVGSNGKAIFTFTLLPGVNLPGSSVLMVAFNGMGAPDGTVIVEAPKTFATPASTGTITTTFFETFTSTTNRDAAETNALWNQSPFTGMLTGLRDGGSGADGTTIPAAVGGVRTFSAKAVWNFTSVNVPKGETWRFTGGAGNDTVQILATSSIDIYGLIDVSGGDGEWGYGDNPYVQSTAYASLDSTRLGGTGIAGGGAGGDSRSLQTTSTGSVFSGFDGVPGKGGGTASTVGKGGVAGTSYTAGHGAGGGAGHAQAGSAGERYANTAGGLGGAGGGTYGTTNFSSGISAGSGGGGGGCANSNNYSGYGGMNFVPGGGGGGGGGAIKFACNGAFKLHGSGVINASGGQGGVGYYYAGSGGAGSGGSIWIISGGNIVLGGVIDVRGGPVQTFGYYAGTSVLTHRGGAGSSGRVRIEAPNLGSTVTNFMGACAINTISSTALDGGTGALGAFPGSSTATINIDSLPKTSGILNFTSMSIPAGVTITLTGTTAAKMRFTQNVSISGTLQANGGIGETGTYIRTTGTYPTRTGGLAAPGGFTGGLPNATGTTNSTATHGGAGSGTGGGLGGKLTAGLAYVYSTWSYTNAYYSGGGGGASNLVHHKGRPGGKYTLYTGYYKAGDGGLAGTGSQDVGALTMSNLVGGPGGGAGANALYLYNTTWNYSYTNYYGAGSGGGGGGGIGIETKGNLSMGSAGKIIVKGGNGGAGYATSVTGGGGGGGAGGTVLLRADNYTISSGATIDTTGGLGTKSWSTYAYYDLNNNGGDGGVGGSRIEAVTLPSIFNQGNLLGYSATTGSLTTAAYQTGDKAATNWQTAPGLAPDFTVATVNKQGAMKVFLEGAMSDPVTGLRSTAITTKPDILTTSFNTTDGYKFWRLVFEMLPPTGALPEVYDVTITNTVK